MPYQKTTYRELPYTFTDPELMVVAKTLSEKLREQNNIEENKKTAVSQFDGQLKAVKSIVAVLSENIRRGHEYRSIECRVYLDTPRKGFKTIIRTDTLETVGEEHMDYADRQTVIQWEEEQERQAANASATDNHDPVEDGKPLFNTYQPHMDDATGPEITKDVQPEIEPEHDTAGRNNEGSAEVVDLFLSALKGVN